MAHIYELSYQKNIKTMVSQFMRIFTGIMVDYEKDYDGDGDIDTRQVKVLYSNMDRVVAEVLHKDGTFVASSLPLISGYITNLAFDPERRKSQTHVDRRAYVGNDGSIKSLERLMPNPYKASFQIYIWSDNTNIKFQILEKIMMLFNPDLVFHIDNDIKNWVNLSRAELVGFSNEDNQPMSTDGRIITDVLDFEVDFWIGAPFKDGDSGIIKQITANITDNKIEIAGIDSITIV